MVVLLLLTAPSAESGADQRRFLVVLEIPGESDADDSVQFCFRLTASLICASVAGSLEKHGLKFGAGDARVAVVRFVPIVLLRTASPISVVPVATWRRSRYSRHFRFDSGTFACVGRHRRFVIFFGSERCRRHRWRGDGRRGRIDGGSSPDCTMTSPARIRRTGAPGTPRPTPETK